MSRKQGFLELLGREATGGHEIAILRAFDGKLMESTCPVNRPILDFAQDGENAHRFFVLTDESVLIQKLVQGKKEGERDIDCQLVGSIPVSEGVRMAAMRGYVAVWNQGGEVTVLNATLAREGGLGSVDRASF